MKFTVHIPSTWVDSKSTLGDTIVGAIGDEIQYALEGAPEDVGLSGAVPTVFHVWKRDDGEYVFSPGNSVQ